MFRQVVNHLYLFGIFLALVLTGCTLPFLNAETNILPMVTQPGLSPAAPTQILELETILPPTTILTSTYPSLLTITETATLLPSLISTNTPLLIPSETITPPHSTPLMLFYGIQPGNPTYMANIFHPAVGCNWLGVSGFVFNSSNQPVESLLIEVGGRLDEKDISLLSMTGVAPIYGAGAYEIILDDHSSASNSTLWIQVKDINSQELSQRFYFDTFLSCDQNLILINFVQSTGGQVYFYLPLLINNPR